MLGAARRTGVLRWETFPRRHGIPLLHFDAKPRRDDILADYRDVLGSGCDPTKLGLDSPVVLRVLRNTPFAVAGRRFDSADLSALYTADGDWYAPSADDISLSKEDTDCVTRLKAHEDRVRSEHCVPANVQTALTTDPEVYAWHRAGALEPMWELSDSTPRMRDVCKSSTGPGNINLSVAIPASAGFTVSGAAAGDRSGESVSGAGDVNGYGIDDFICREELRGRRPGRYWARRPPPRFYRTLGTKKCT